MNQNRKKVIIVGKTGHGKSSLGNSLLRMKRFKEGGGFNACSLTCQKEKNEQFEIVDTPGLFDTNQNRNVAQQAEQIIKALKQCPAPHAFLIVVRYGRFTEEEVSVLDVLKITFGEQYLDYAIVVVTDVDNDLTDADLTNACLESHKVTELLNRCGRRVVRIDNKNPKQGHVNILVEYIDQVSNYGNSCFNNDYLRCHDEVLRRSAQDLNKYDGMLVHAQVEQIANEIRTTVNEEVTTARREREERARRESEEREREEIARREREEREEREREERARREREEREERERQQQEIQDQQNRRNAAIAVVTGALALLGVLFRN